MHYIYHYLLIGVIFALIDAVWIGVVANKFYTKQLGSLLRAKPDFVPAVLFYLIYIAALQILILEPALTLHSLVHAAVYAAVFGVAAYAAYDLTNASTLKNWPKAVTIVDMLWGTGVTTAVSVIAYLILA